MKNIKTFLGASLLALALSTVSTTAVMAQSKLELSANVGITSDYVWRGFSQTDGGPAAQGGIDATYGMFYAGVWGSNLAFADEAGGSTASTADFEVDLYAGIKPKLGTVEFDLGAIYYMYPGANDTAAEYNFLELKAGASTSFDKLSVGATVYYSPETYAKGGRTLTYEGTAEYALPMEFAISGTLGRFTYDDTPANDYSYWNVGLSKSFGEHWSIDARYWDTNKDASTCVSNTGTKICDSRIVGTVAFSF